MKKFFLVRSAAPMSGSGDPDLSTWGKEQALCLAEKIATHVNDEAVTIWSPWARCASSTARAVHKRIPYAEMVIKEHLWSSNHPYDSEWLGEQIKHFTGEVLIVIASSEYVQDFPDTLGHGRVRAHHAEGVLIENGQMQKIEW